MDAASTLSSPTRNSLSFPPSLPHLAKHAVTTVEVGCGDGADEELGAVGVGASVCHRQHAGAAVLVLVVEVLVGKLLAVDGLAAPAVSPRDVASLAHKVLDCIAGGTWGVRSL
jgi:hypothetical protein